MVKIYTRTGDDGETSLLGGKRVRKDDLRIEAIGSVDEVNAALGLVRAEIVRGGVNLTAVDELLGKVQHQLFEFGAELAVADASQVRSEAIGDAEVEALEAAIDRFEEGLEPLREFILPGGSPAAAQVHVARCDCRRAERRLVELALVEAVRGELVRYLNRLSDLLFVLARAVNRDCGVADVKWRRGER